MDEAAPAGDRLSRCNSEAVIAPKMMNPKIRLFLGSDLSDPMNPDPKARLYLGPRGSSLRGRMNNELNFPPNFERLVLGCIDADICK